MNLAIGSVFCGIGGWALTTGINEHDAEAFICGTVLLVVGAIMILTVQ